MGTWLNADGLYIKYGQSNDTTANLGEYDFDGPDHYIEMIINGTDLATATDNILADNVVIPNGARIKKVELYVAVAFTSGGSATLDVGTIGTDRSTVTDADGLIAAVPLASINTAGLNLVWSKVGDNSAMGGPSSYGGAQVGTTLSQKNLITAGANTAVFTAGKARLRIFYYIP